MAISGDVFRLNGYTNDVLLGNTAVGNKTHGWFCGGIPTNTSIVRMSFSNDLVGPNQRAMTTNPVNISAAGNNSTDLWTAGGSGGGTLSYITRLTFANDTSNSLLRGNLPAAKRNIGCNHSLTDSWFGGDGDGTTPTSTMNRLIYSNDTLGGISKGVLSVARAGAEGIGNFSDSWFCGGFPTTASTMTVVDRLNHATDAINCVAKGNLAVTVASGLGWRTPNTGWIPGGFSGNTSSYGSGIQRIEYSSDTINALTRANIGQVKGRAGATDDYISQGWLAAGETTGGGDISNIDRLIFASDTVNTSIRSFYPFNAEAMTGS